MSAKILLGFATPISTVPQYPMIWQIFAPPHCGHHLWMVPNFEVFYLVIFSSHQLIASRGVRALSQCHARYGYGWGWWKKFNYSYAQPNALHDIGQVGEIKPSF